MSFGETNLIERIGEVQTLADAFDALKGLEFTTQKAGSCYQVLVGRREFVIVVDLGSKGSQLLHPYGRDIFYAFRELLTSTPA